MTGYEVYIFVMCLVVFVALTLFFATLITYIVRLNVKLIRGGLSDAEIKRQRDKRKKVSPVFNVLEKALSFVFLAAAIVVFALSLSIKINENNPVGTSVVKVVKSSSMATKDEHNKYLFDNNLNNQIQMFDVIKVEPLPAEDKLKLYDIVVYEADGQMIVHRIVGIKEPDETYSERRFVLQGDANRATDKFPVLYSQMKGIYAETKVPYVGSFIVFMNSPAGYLCILLIVVACIGYPVVDKKLRKEIELRLIAAERKEKNIIGANMNIGENNARSKNV